MTTSVHFAPTIVIILCTQATIMAGHYTRSNTQAISLLARGKTLSKTSGQKSSTFGVKARSSPRCARHTT